MSHPFEEQIGADANLILDALYWSNDITVRGIRGVIGEAAFVRTINKLNKWEIIREPNSTFPYDVKLSDDKGVFTVQVKLQRKLKGKPWMKNGFPQVEIQRMHGGIDRNGESTRPYRFGDFDILAVCLEPLSQSWFDFRYIPTKWLKPNDKNQNWIDTIQPVIIEPNDRWSLSFEQCVNNLRL